MRKFCEEPDVCEGLYRRCSKYILILNWTAGFKRLCKDNRTWRGEKHLSFGIGCHLY